MQNIYFYICKSICFAQVYVFVYAKVYTVYKTYKHLKKSNAACFYTPIVLKLLIIVQMW